MTRRNVIRITSFITLGLVILVVSATSNARDMNRYKNQLEITYQQSLSELNEYLDTVNTDLTKSLYSNSAQELSDISRDLYAQCSAAKNAVSRLPVSQMELGNTYKFLSQASDYAAYIGTKIRSGGTVSEQEHKNLLSLLQYAQQFSAAATQMVNIVESGAKITDGNVKSTTQLSAAPLSTGFKESAKTFEAFPTLLYDGPFSDQVLNKKSELLRQSKVKGKNDCLAVVSRSLKIAEDKIGYDSDDKSIMPCYTFKTGRYTVSVTKQGGYLKSILYSGIITDSSISEENAVNLAAAFLQHIGYTDMKESYYSVNDNVCTVNFAYAKGGVYCYSDLIKCAVSMADGSIVSLDAATYLTNHIEREPFSAEVSADEAEKRLSPYLTVSDVKKCVIPKENGTEAMCWEFTCTSKDTGEDALVYINSNTAEEEDIMLLLYSDNGTLVK